MNKFLPALMLALLACQSAVADETPASEGSVRELLAVMDSRKAIENTLSQVDAMMQASIKDALQGKTLTADQERIFADMGPGCITMASGVASLRRSALKPNCLK